MAKTKSILLILASLLFLLACDKADPAPTPDPDSGKEQGGGNEGGGQGGSQGGGAIDPAKLPETVLFQDFTSGLGGFRVENKEKGGFTGGDIWKFKPGQAKYGAQATGSVEVDSDNRTNYATEGWLISPVLDLNGYTELYLYFEHAFAYVRSGKPQDFFGLKITDDDGETWNDLPLPSDQWRLPNSYFELDQSGNVSLSAYVNKKVKFAFVYKSTTTVAGTWEVLNVKVSKTPQVIEVDDKGDKYTSIPTWMELPQATDPTSYFVHTTILRFERTRNFSFNYNESCLVADWVAYPLYDQIAKPRVKRSSWSSDPWDNDPFVAAAGKKQSNVANRSFSNDTEGNSYDRGHQLPSADRTGGAMANMQTFYHVNLTPQLSDFNQGIWNELEIKVRDMAAGSNGTDTLYVVTGCVVNPECPTVYDNNNQTVSIPKAYYKALLRLDKDGNYSGAGFYLNHESGIDKDTPIKDFALSLKELEDKVNLTFFVNLPESVATTVKAQDPKENGFWWNVKPADY
jgi:DNA/RNA endonuclease G (NUC1)